MSYCHSPPSVFPLPVGFRRISQNTLVQEGLEFRNLGQDIIGESYTFSFLKVLLESDSTRRASISRDSIPPVFFRAAML